MHREVMATTQAASTPLIIYAFYLPVQRKSCKLYIRFQSFTIDSFIATYTVRGSSGCTGVFVLQETSDCSPQGYFVLSMFRDNNSCLSCLLPVLDSVFLTDCCPFSSEWLHETPEFGTKIISELSV